MAGLNQVARKILTLRGQAHGYENLAEIFTDITKEERVAIIEALGLSGVIDPDGNIAPKFSVDITSDKPTFVTKDFDITLTASVYNFFVNVEDEVESYQWYRDSGNEYEDIQWSEGKVTKSITLSKLDFPPSFNTEDVTFRVAATIKGETVEDFITFSRFQYLSPVQINSTATVFTDAFPERIVFTYTTEAEVESQRWYVNNVLQSVTPSFSILHSEVTPKTSVTVKLEVETTEGTTITDSISIPRVVSGEDGIGIPGQDGASTYTWVKYADDEVGTNMSDSPIKSNGQPYEYIGIAFNKDVPEESPYAVDYTWSKYVGDQGIPGENGYMWIKYSEFENGRDLRGNVSMSDVPSIEDPNGGVENFTYMGIAYNKQTKQESNIPEDYEWSKIKGDDGHSNYLLDLSNDNVSVPTRGDGSIPNPSVAFSTAYTYAVLYYGNEPVDRSEYSLVVTASPGVTYTTSEFNHKIQITGLTADSAEIVIKAIVYEGPTVRTLTTSTFSVTKVKGASIYEISPSVSSIKVQSNSGTGQTLIPTTIQAKVLVNSGDTVSETTVGKMTMRYIYPANPGEDSDGNLYTIGSTINISNAGNPLFIEFKYFHPTTNALVDRERIPFVRDGIDGVTTEFRYAKNSDPLTPPPIQNNVAVPPGWGLNFPVMGAPTEVLWMTKANKTQSGGELIGVWATPVRVTGPAGPSGSGYSVVSSNPIQTISVGQDGVASLTKTYEVTIDVYSNSTKLTASQGGTLNNNTYEVQVPPAPASGITVEKISANTLKYTVFPGTSFLTNKAGKDSLVIDSVVSTINILIGSAAVSMKSSFTIAPITSAEDTFSLDLVTSSTVAKYDKNGALIGPSTIDFNVIQQNYAETVTWSTTPPVSGLNGFQGTVKSINTATLFAGGTNTVKVSIATPNGLYDQVTIVKVRDGSDGEPGIPGPSGGIPRMFEWKKGATYLNGPIYTDFIYYRSDSPSLDGWYIVKRPNPNVATQAVANAEGPPNTALFERQDFKSTGTFGTIIANQANLAGFIFRGGVLVSQDRSSLSCETTDDKGPYPNLTIDGVAGIIKFLENMILSKDGITIKDDCGRIRLAILFENGVPLIRFYGPNGEKIWEAGQNNFGGTTLAFFTPQVGIKVSVPVSSNIPPGPTILSELSPYIKEVNGAYALSAPLTNVYGHKYVKMNPQLPTLPEHNKTYKSESLSSGVVEDGWYLTSINDGSTRYDTGQVVASFVKIVGGDSVTYISRGYSLIPDVEYRYYTADMYGGSGDILTANWTDKDGVQKSDSVRGHSAGNADWMSISACAVKGSFYSNGTVIENGPC